MRHSPTWVLLLMLAGCATTPPLTATGPEPKAPERSSLDATPASMAAPAPAAEGQVAPARWRVASEKGKARASSGMANLAVDGDRQSEWNPRTAIKPGAPQWLALPLEAPAAGTLAVAWHGHGMHYQYGEYGRPRSYEVQVSSNSTDGDDGDWRTVETITDNMVRSRVATFKAPGARWVRLRFLDVWDGRYQMEPYIREAAVYEAEGAGAADVWLVMGDSVTSVGFDPAEPDTFTGAVAERHPGHWPILLSGGTGGDEAANAVKRLEVALPTLPPGSVVGLCYGTNDATRGVSVADYKARLQVAIDMLKAAGHQPVVAVVPWSLNGRIAEYAAACRELTAANDLPPGPDFFGYFKAHPEELRTDKVHPTEAGVRSMQRLWAETAAWRYAR
ncbi:multifunctional acyl-CoA thioesterase I and protease I and lysophospholipase L1 [compost metagenome]